MRMEVRDLSRFYNKVVEGEAPEKPEGFVTTARWDWQWRPAA
ncbi:hypothetical protein BRAS3843_2120007 [Bradyrhizobium sp. STM 3843]|nr:hypothetical protein BRAS3843_2120007 [Bradyrhizobium sp. STM 3843]